jgi:dTDP-4-dehydrorhamnose 3,5-epimerase
MADDITYLPPSRDFIRIVEPRLFIDDLGYSLETSSDPGLDALRLGLRFAQERLEHNRCGAIRGLHYQLKAPQAKLFRVVTGAIFFVAVDLRKSSPEFGLATCLELTDESRQAVWAPEGYACGYMSLVEDTKVLIKASVLDEPLQKRTLLWNDPEISIKWPEGVDAHVSRHDAAGRPLHFVEPYD